MSQALIAALAPGNGAKDHAKHFGELLRRACEPTTPQGTCTTP